MSCSDCLLSWCIVSLTVPLGSSCLPAMIRRPSSLSWSVWHSVSIAQSLGLAAVLCSCSQLVFISRSLTRNRSCKPVMIRRLTTQRLSWVLLVHGWLTMIIVSVRGWWIGATEVLHTVVDNCFQSHDSKNVWRSLLHELGVLNSEMKHSWFSWDAAIYQTTSRSRGSLHAKCRQGVLHWILISSCK